MLQKSLKQGLLSYNCDIKSQSNNTTTDPYCGEVPTSISNLHYGTSPEKGSVVVLFDCDLMSQLCSLIILVSVVL